MRRSACRRCLVNLGLALHVQRQVIHGDGRYSCVHAVQERQHGVGVQQDAVAVHGAHGVQKHGVNRREATHAARHDSLQHRPLLLAHLARHRQPLPLRMQPHRCRRLLHAACMHTQVRQLHAHGGGKAGARRWRRRRVAVAAA